MNGQEKYEKSHFRRRNLTEETEGEQAQGLGF